MEHFSLFFMAAPNSQYRAVIVNQASSNKHSEKPVRTEGEKRGAMAWSARLKRVFNIDMNTCESCGGAVKVIACIDDPVVINKILTHLQVSTSNLVVLPVSRAPPAGLLFD